MHRMQPTANPEQRRRLERVVDRHQRIEGGSVRKYFLGRIVDVGGPHREVCAAEEIPHERRTVLQIGDRMFEDGVGPGPGQSGGAEKLFLALQFFHDEFARFQPPINVPQRRLVAAIDEQRRLGRGKGHGKLVLLGEMADAAEVEDHDRVQRMLPRGMKHAVIDELHQSEQRDPDRHKP